MHPKRRERLLRVLDNTPEILTLLWHMDGMRRADDVLDWLITHNLTGKNLFEWFHVEHKESFLSLMAFVVNELEKNKKGKEKRPLYDGRDFT